MGSWHLHRAEFADAEKFSRQAIQTLTLRNPNPYEGEAFYNLGLTLRYLSRDEEAYAAFYKAAWNSAWRSAAYLALAELDAIGCDWNASIAHLESSLRMNTEKLNARNLSVVVLRKLGRGAEADRLLKETLALDPLDSWARYLASNSLPSSNHMLFDLAFDYIRAGLHADAVEFLGRMDRDARDGSVPILLYALGHIYLQLGNTADAKRAYLEASSAAPDYCFPSRLEEFVVLQEAVSANPEDARARITWAIFYTTAGGTVKRSPCGNGPRLGIRLSPRSGATLESVISMCSEIRSCLRQRNSCRSGRCAHSL